MESLPSLSRIADAALHPCKICATPSPLFGVVDFHKSCIETTGHGLPLSGIPIYYRRCPRCAFSFTTAFDDWPPAAFLEHIYNADYLHIDPDYAERRPTNNARFIAETFQATRSTIQILDYGGGNGILAQRLRDQHFNAATYDPFSAEKQFPTHRFDLITCFEVLEHVPDPQARPSTASTRSSRDQGAILFSTLLQPESFEPHRPHLVVRRPTQRPRLPVLAAVPRPALHPPQHAGPLSFSRTSTSPATPNKPTPTRPTGGPPRSEYTRHEVTAARVVPPSGRTRPKA